MNKAKETVQVSIPSNTDLNQSEKLIDLGKGELAQSIFTFQCVRSKKSDEVTVNLKGLYREGMITLLKQNGFAKKYLDTNTIIFIKDDSNVIEEVSATAMRETVQAYIEALETIKVDYDGETFEFLPEMLRETFYRQNHLIFNQGFLELLETHYKPILKDNKTTKTE